jgi:hypothetical protein
MQVIDAYHPPPPDVFAPCRYLTLAIDGSVAGRRAYNSSSFFRTRRDDPDTAANNVLLKGTDSSEGRSSELFLC